MSNDQKEAIDCLGQFIDFIYDELAKINAGRYFKRKKAVLLPMYVNACDLASSVHILLKEERVNASQNLMRSLQETWINTRFIFIDGDYRWVDSYLLESELDMKKFVNGVRKLRTKYPKVDTGIATFTDKKLDEIEARSKKFVSETLRKHGTLSIPDVTTNNISSKPYTLRDKTVITDTMLSKKAKNGFTYSDEYQYLMVYKYLSGGTHVGASYLATNMVRKDKTGVTILKHGNKANIQLCAWTAYSFLFDISKIFGQQFKYPTATSLRKYQKIINELRDKIPD